MNKRTVYEEAAHWFAELERDSATLDSHRQWQRWMAASPAHAKAFRDMEETAARLLDSGARPALPSAEEMSADEYDGSVPISDFKRRRIAPKRFNLRFAMAAGIAAAALLGGGIWFGLRPDPLHGTFSFHTAPGERKTIALAEGSKISLDADTVLNVILTPERRSLALVRGEAFFAVAKNPSRPFIVSAGGTEVRAVGTAFNVRMNETRTVVAVIEGKVEVTPASTSDPPAAMQSSMIRVSSQVSAGQAVSYSRNGHIDSLPAAGAAIATTWRDGRRQYLGEPLRDVLADIERYTGRRIELADQSAGDLKFTGTLRLENSDAWLKGLSVALPVQIESRDDGTLSVKLTESR